MKTMTCRQLGGACDQEFHANTFEEMAEQSKRHAMEMINKGDETHITAMKNMQEMMKSPDAMKHWMEVKRKEFNLLPDNQ